MWSKDVPKAEGWFWVKYQGKKGQVVCPALIIHMNVHKGSVVHSARNDIFVDHGDGFTYQGKEEAIEFWSEEIIAPPLPKSTKVGKKATTTALAKPRLGFD